MIKAVKIPLAVFYLTSVSSSDGRKGQATNPEVRTSW